MNDNTIHIANNAKNTKNTHFKNPPIHWLFIESCGSLSLIVNKTLFLSKIMDGLFYPE